MRRAIFLVHLYVGLSLGLLASVIGLSGSLLVFRHELEARFYPTLKGARASARTRTADFSPQAVVESVRQAFPDKRIQTLNLPSEASAPVEIWLDKDPLRIYVDPNTAEIVGSRDEDASFFGRLFNLHTEFLAGEKGHTLAGITGIGLIVLLLTGIVLWWPRKNQKFRDSVRIKWSAGLKRASYDFHRAIGFFAFGFLLFIAITGVALVFPDPARNLVFGIAGQPDPPGKPKAGKAQPTADLDRLVDQAHAVLPEGTVRRIVLPLKPGDPLLVRIKLKEELHPNGVNYVYVDPATGEVLRTDYDSRGHAGQQAMNLRYPLHIGLWAGLISRILQVLLGLVPTLLMVSGFLVWRNRLRGKKRAAKSRAGS